MFVDSSHLSRLAQILFKSAAQGHYLPFLWQFPKHKPSVFSLYNMYNTMEEEEYEFEAVDLPDEPCFCPQAEFNGKPDFLFFNDGVRRIDYVLVYEDEDKKDFEKRHTFARRKVLFSL